MKNKVITIALSVILLTSCTKDWECCIESTTTHTDPSLTQLNGTTNHCVEFRGTIDEKEEYQDAGTSSQTYPEFTGSGTYTINQETTCVPD